MSTIDFSETFRPQFHFTPPSKWINDPNGMVYFEGEYHLFYQYYPEGTTWGPMHWGHAVSRNLVHWEYLPIALKPDHNGYIFSGSAVVDWNDTSGFFSGQPGLVAIFTHADQYPDSDCPRQRQSLAYSIDKGRTWTVYEGNPVLSDETLTDFRDPKVFRYTPNDVWIMVLAAGDRVRFYTSKNLKDWSLASEFGAAEGCHDGVWECPDLIELPVDGNAQQTKWVLIVSIGDNPQFPEGSRTQYFIGHFDGFTFANDSSPETVLWLDHGRDNYAGVTWSDSPSRNGEKLFIGWMSNWKYANVTPTDVWRGAMTIPRVVSLKTDSDGICLYQAPIDEFQGLRQQSRYGENVTIDPDKMLIADMQGSLHEIELEFEFDSAAEMGIALRNTDGEETIIGYDTRNQRVYIDRSNCGETSFHAQFACRHSAHLKSCNQRVKIHLFVDWSSVEMFANDGKVVMTDQIFPNSPVTRMELFAREGSARVNFLAQHSLRSIHSIKQPGNECEKQ